MGQARSQRAPELNQPTAAMLFRRAASEDQHEGTFKNKVAYLALCIRADG